MYKKIFISNVIFILSFCLSISSLYALPEIDEVASGSATIEYPDANTMKIDAADNTIINYNSFNIKENESVIVNLPSATSEILNRVTGGIRSDISGNLSCNGLFILVNTSGIYVAPTANVNVGSIILSTRDITDKDFLEKKHLFKKISQEEFDALLVNRGSINIKESGFGVFIAGAIENHGRIVAPLGKIALASGDAVKVDISNGG
ncbi:MAG: filamentous hemagglutinin N-terminal domain-containing protein, partial [Candidatus Omnitrophica bacterium]|nr:filamentous hemagglutinin N-terminal domain-containing protein [Candidatus Omnitrophota bacterium]